MLRFYLILIGEVESKVRSPLKKYKKFYLHIFGYLFAIIYKIIFKFIKILLFSTLNKFITIYRFESL